LQKTRHGAYNKSQVFFGRSYANLKIKCCCEY